jgi:glycerol-3-phosphate acyltransferase PlsY
VLYLDYLIVAVAAYLLGSIPTGFLAAKVKGIDLRAVGSGNIGATNAMRALGKPAGIFVLLVDMAKGFAAVALAITQQLSHIFPTVFPADVIIHPSYDPIMNHGIVAGVFVVLGHNYTCWLKFKGGKGVATTAGVYLALAPWAVLVAMAVFILAVLLTRYASVGSISAAVALPVTIWLMSPHDWLLGVVTTALGALVIYRHKSNIQRLLAGTENRLGKKLQSQSTEEKQ